MNGKRAREYRRQIAEMETIRPEQKRRAYRLQKRMDDALRRAQHPKLTEPRRHLHPAPIKPTWPHTPDQARQGRPLIMKHPVRMFAATMRRIGAPLSRYELAMEATLPKHELDRKAQPW